MTTLPWPFLPRNACVHMYSVVSASLRLHGLQPTGLLCPWNFPGKDAEVGCHFLPQGVFPTQGSNLHLVSCIGRRILYHWRHLGSPQVTHDTVLKRAAMLLNHFQTCYNHKSWLFSMIILTNILWNKDFAEIFRMEGSSHPTSHIIFPLVQTGTCLFIIAFQSKRCNKSTLLQD